MESRGLDVRKTLIYLQLCKVFSNEISFEILSYELVQSSIKIIPLKAYS